MVEISLSGSGEGPQEATTGAYFTEDGHPSGAGGLEARRMVVRENELTDWGLPSRAISRARRLRLRSDRQAVLPRLNAKSRLRRAIDGTWLLSDVDAPRIQREGSTTFVVAGHRVSERCLQAQSASPSP
jgi:hypothetical protein